LRKPRAASAAGWRGPFRCKFLPGTLRVCGFSLSCLALTLEAIEKPAMRIAPYGRVILFRASTRHSRAGLTCSAPAELVLGFFIPPAHPKLLLRQTIRAYVFSLLRSW